MTRRQRPGRVGAALGLAMVVPLAAAWLCPGADAAISWKKKIDDKEIKLTFYGFAQYEARAGEGTLTDSDGIRFNAQRIRLGFNYFHGDVFSKLFLDFNQFNDLRESADLDDYFAGGLPSIIKDGFAGYRWNNAAYIKIGMMKTPVGMDFTVPGWNLDIVERQGLEKGLALERDFGVMLSGRLIGGGMQEMKVNGTEMGHERWGSGFGYDIGVFNPAGRSLAVIWDEDILGDALAYAGRVHYDVGGWLHTELSYGVSEQAGGLEDPQSEDYNVVDFGINTFLLENRLNLKGEYISGTNIRGDDGRDQSTLVITGAYRVHRQIELVVKHYQSSSTRDDTLTAVDSDLGNTYLGVNYFLQPLQDKPRVLQNHRLMLNYVIASGDAEEWAGIGGYRDDIYMFQYQIKW